MKGIMLPEFDKNKRIDEQGAFVFEGPCRYDIIFGRDFLRKVGLQMDFANAQMRWMEHLVPMRDDATWNNGSLFVDDQTENEAYASEILDAKYEKMDPIQVAEQQTHLTPLQRKQLGKLLSKFTRLFDGTLGLYPHKKIHLEVDPQATPIHSRAYCILCQEPMRRSSRKNSSTW